MRPASTISKECRAVLRDMDGTLVTRERLACAHTMADFRALTVARDGDELLVTLRQSCQPPRTSLSFGTA